MPRSKQGLELRNPSFGRLGSDFGRPAGGVRVPAGGGFFLAHSVRLGVTEKSLAGRRVTKA